MPYLQYVYDLLSVFPTILSFMTKDTALWLCVTILGGGSIIDIEFLSHGNPTYQENYPYFSHFDKKAMIA